MGGLLSEYCCYHILSSGLGNVCTKTIIFCKDVNKSSIVHKDNVLLLVIKHNIIAKSVQLI